MFKIIINSVISQILTAYKGEKLFGGKITIIDTTETSVVAELTFKKAQYKVTIEKIA